MYVLVRVDLVEEDWVEEYKHECILVRVDLVEADWVEE